MKTADLKTMYLRDQLNRRGVAVDFTQAETLRRAQLALHRWAELECGDSTSYASFAIERDETTGKPFMVTHRHDSNKSHRRPIPDRERGALARVLTICAAVGAHYYHQTDPRGCALYVAAEVLTDQNYTNGVACCV